MEDRRRGISTSQIRVPFSFANTGWHSFAFKPQRDDRGTHPLMLVMRSDLLQRDHLVGELVAAFPHFAANTGQ